MDSCKALKDRLSVKKTEGVTPFQTFCGSLRERWGYRHANFYPKMKDGDDVKWLEEIQSRLA